MNMSGDMEPFEDGMHKVNRLVEELNHRLMTDAEVAETFAVQRLLPALPDAGAYPEADVIFRWEQDGGAVEVDRVKLPESRSGGLQAGKTYYIREGIAAGVSPQQLQLPPPALQQGVVITKGEYDDYQRLRAERCRRSTADQQLSPMTQLAIFRDALADIMRGGGWQGRFAAEVLTDNPPLRLADLMRMETPDRPLFDAVTDEEVDDEPLFDIAEATVDDPQTRDMVEYPGDYKGCACWEHGSAGQQAGVVKPLREVYQGGGLTSYVCDACSDPQCMDCVHCLRHCRCAVPNPRK